LKRTVDGISQQMLTRTLRALERFGFVERTVHPTLPPQVEYALTDLGRSLAEPLEQLGTWVYDHLEQVQDSERAYFERNPAAVR